MVMSSNEKIANRMIRHAVFLERFKNFEADKIAALLNKEVLPDVMNAIRQIERLGLNPRKQKQAEKILRAVLGEGVGSAGVKFAEGMKDLSAAEGVFSQTAMEKVIPFGVSFDKPSARLLNTIVTQEPFRGEVLKDWFGDLSNVMQKNINRQLRVGMSLGETVGELSQRIRGTAAAKFGDGVWAQQMRKAEAVARTAINHVSNAAREATFQQNKDILKGEQFVAVLDDRTTIICINANEADEYDLGPGIYPVGAAPQPPLHFNCRSTLAPVTKSWQELGIPLKEMPPGFRIAMDGKPAEDVTYSQWLKKQDFKTQREVLGKTKAELFNRGMTTIDKFENARGVTLTIPQILKNEGIAREDVYSLAA